LNDVPLGTLFTVLGLLLVLSAFFSSTETALMSINRYRLRHRARQGQRSARLAEALLQRPDRLIGLILLGNNFVNIFASSLVTVIALRLGGEGAIAIGAGVLTLVILIFAEVAPKTLAALHPERIALPAALIYFPLLKVTYPIVWLVNLMANGVLRLLGVRMEHVQGHGSPTRNCAPW
jgi:Mg2+/Co2+ transporter CorB